MEESEIKISVGKYDYTFYRELNELDCFTLKFVQILNEMGINYVVVSGYVSILFGRSRLSEDIDVLIERLDFPEFLKLWNALSNEFWCIITSKPEDAYHNYILNQTAIRFALKDKIIPNIELKFPKTSLDEWVLNNAISATVDGQKIRISNIEIQIAFKLYLSTEKDIEDAKHLYEMFKEAIDENLLGKFIRMLNVDNLARRYLGWMN